MHLELRLYHLEGSCCIGRHTLSKHHSVHITEKCYNNHMDTAQPQPNSLDPSHELGEPDHLLTSHPRKTATKTPLLIGALVIIVLASVFGYFAAQNDSQSLPAEQLSPQNDSQRSPNADTQTAVITNDLESSEQSVVEEDSMMVEDDSLVETYIDEEFSYQITYDTSWTLTRTYGEGIEKQGTTDILSGIDLRTTSAGIQQANIVVNVLNSYGEEDIDAWIAAYDLNAPVDGIRIEDTIGEISAIRFEDEASASVPTQRYTYYFIFGPYVYRIFASEHNQISPPTMQTLSTFKP